MRYKCFPLCVRLAVLPPAETDKIVQCTTECTPSTTSLVRECFCLLAQKGKCASLKVLQYVLEGKKKKKKKTDWFYVVFLCWKNTRNVFFPCIFYYYYYYQDCSNSPSKKKERKCIPPPVGSFVLLLSHHASKF